MAKCWDHILTNEFISQCELTTEDVDRYQNQSRLEPLKRLFISESAIQVL